MTVFLGTLGCSIKRIEPPYVFDWEHGIALHAMKGNRVSSDLRGGCLMGFHELQKEPRVYSRVTAGMAVRNSAWFSEVRIPV